MVLVLALLVRLARMVAWLVRLATLKALEAQEAGQRPQQAVPGVQPDFVRREAVAGPQVAAKPLHQLIVVLIRVVGFLI